VDGAAEKPATIADNRSSLILVLDQSKNGILTYNEQVVEFNPLTFSNIFDY
jgi:hypothetical protein